MIQHTESVTGLDLLSKLIIFESLMIISNVSFIFEAFGARSDESWHEPIHHVQI